MDLRFGIGGILGGLIALAGIVVLASFLRSIRSGHATRGWSATAGTVVTSTVAPETLVRPNEIGLSNRFVIRYAPYVVYRYVADGRQWQGDRIAAGPQMLSSDEAAAARAAARYPLGCPVQVYYDPLDPGRAVLRRGNPWSWIPPAIAAGLLVLAALVVWLFATSAPIRP